MVVKAMRMIKLTEVKRRPEFQFGKSIRYFNADKIESLRRLDDCTHLYMSTSGRAFEVLETPEEIIELIKQAEEI